ncbi:MAG TPA: SsrA-binding protein SmpB [Candidatus Acidoferrales bacterium]|nr:SsrA-binding protein SmpB [Candidatus Acidoferrales bacterium]
MAQKTQKQKKTASGGELVVAQNRSASYHYMILEKFEAGMVLRGTEVKAIREGKANIREAYALVRGGELWLENCHIAEYDAGGVWNHTPLSTRKLLMHKEEIRRLFGKTQQKGLTLIALRLYFRGGRAKCELALARGKKDWDRRDQERNKEAEREAKEAIYRSRRR